MPPAVCSTRSLYSSADPRDLHSFPTRRSSDLEHGDHVPDKWEVEARGVSNEVLSSVVSRRHRIRRVRDRKSTRLNSSHVEISYAVFCLKKKIREDVTPEFSTFRATADGLQGEM